MLLSSIDYTITCIKENKRKPLNDENIFTSFHSQLSIKQKKQTLDIPMRPYQNYFSPGRISLYGNSGVSIINLCLTLESQTKSFSFLLLMKMNRYLMFLKNKILQKMFYTVFCRQMTVPSGWYIYKGWCVCVCVCMCYCVWSLLCVSVFVLTYVLVS